MWRTGASWPTYSVLLALAASALELPSECLCATAVPRSSSSRSDRRACFNDSPWLGGGPLINLTQHQDLRATEAKANCRRAVSISLGIANADEMPEIFCELPSTVWQREGWAERRVCGCWSRGCMSFCMARAYYIVSSVVAPQWGHPRVAGSLLVLLDAAGQHTITVVMRAPSSSVRACLLPWAQSSWIERPPLDIVVYLWRASSVVLNCY